MTDEANKKGPERTRREFLTATTALAGAALVGLARRSRRRAQAHIPNAAARCASARATIPSASIPIATSSTSSRSRWPALTGGLLDFDAKMESGRGHRHGMGASADLKTWTFKLRRGAEFHNGETIDAEAIKWNIERILDPKIGHSFTRSALTDVERVTVDDKHTVQLPSQGAERGLRYQPRLLPGQPHGAGLRRQGRHAIRWAAGRSSSSRGSASTSASWCASRTSGRPMPRATRCLISTA